MTEIATAKALGVSSALSATGGAYFALTDAVAISAITSIAAVVMAAVSAWFAYKAKAIGVETHKIVNSRMTELLEISRASSKAEGKLEAKTEEQQKETK